MEKQHHFRSTIVWTGDKGTGTSAYSAYGRNHTISMPHKPEIAGSADPAFLGDQTRHNPEDLMLASLSGCHMLWYLHLCADAGVIVTGYTDNATAIMTQEGAYGAFTEVTLNPVVTVTDASMIDKANELHDKAHEHCFMARSVNFPVKHQPRCVAAKQD